MARRAAACLTLLTLAAAPLAIPAGPALAADVTGGLVLRYPLDATSGAVAADSSGNGRDGVVNGTATWTAGQGLGFNGSNTYVKLPDNVMAGLSSITVSTDVFIDTTQASPYFIYGMGNSSAGAGNGYLFTTGDNYRTSISNSNWTGEQNAAGSGPLTRGVWKHIDYTLTGGTAVLYEDGQEVGRNTGVTHTPGSIGGGTTTSNFLGRSLYSADNYFKGRLRDFRIYNRALTVAEVQEIALPISTDLVAKDKAALTLGDTSAVTANLALPAKGANGSAVTWATSDASVVSATGTVTRPAAGQPDAKATLTATLTKGAATATKTFDVTVAAQFSPDQAAAAAANALKLHSIDDVRGNLTLPTTGVDGATVAWASDKPAVISNTGVVKRPAPGAGNTTVELTATVTLNGATATKTFTAKVPELPVQQALKGYLFSYFVGEGTAEGEQVYNALSKGNDPLNWRELNGGNPVLTSTLGDKGLRDPFIIRSPEGDKFYQIATDLRIYGNGNWDASQRTGSKSIMVWESTDLVHWTDQRLVKVSPDTAGNTWAPEAYYDDELGAYVVFWASKLYAADDPNHTGNTYNKMMYATTRDFATFSEAKVWNDPGYSVIDSTMTKNGDTYYRFTKDERNNTSTTPCSKFITAEKSTTILNPKYAHIADCIGKGSISQGEGPTIFKSNTENKWYLFIDEFGGRGYIPFETTDLESGQWTLSTGYSFPTRPRHGTVLPVTQAEYDRVLKAFSPDQYIESAEDTPVTTGVGQAPVLPATVKAHYADGTVKDTAVTWDAVPASAYAAAGTFTVEGSLGAGVTVKAKAQVTVSAAGIPVESLTVSPTSLRLGVGVTRKITATVTPANATARDLTWTSGDPAIATVSATGVVTTVTTGDTTITVKTADSSKSVTIPVKVTAEIPADLLVAYDFDETGGNVANDASGRGNNGTYVRTPAFGTGVHGGSFKMSGGGSTSTTAPYVSLPVGVLKDVNAVTVSAHVKWTASTTINQWIFGLGTGDAKYLFASPANGNRVLYSAITTGSWSAESKMAGSAILPGGTWKHVTVTVDSATKTAVLYLDGVEVARATNVTVKPSDLYDATKTNSGYIGKSLYASDPYFAGEVDDFRIYSRALPAAEVLELAGNTTGISGVTLPELKVPAIITNADSKIVLPVKPGTDLTKLAPEFALAHGSTISPSGPRDLSAPVTYTVTGSDGAQRTWTVQARVMKSPVIPGLSADPNITVFGDTFYMYPTTDGFAGWSGTQFKAYSSKDLVNWTDHGVILDLGPDITWADNSAWAPTMAEKDGKYYFYFSGGLATGNTGKHLGVAVSDSPTGPFRDALGKPLVAAGTYSGQMIDPQVFTDNDGKSYLYWGNGNGYQVPLNDDMVSFDATKLKTYKPTGYNEGSVVFHRGDIYYWMWSENDTRDENYQVAYATGSSPLGPWTKQGVILQKDLSLGIKGPGHNSVVKVPNSDDWYIAYHRFAIPGGDGTHRETTIDKMEFNPDGTIKTVKPTLESVDPVAVAHAGPDVTGTEGEALTLAGKVSTTTGAKWTHEAGAPCSFADDTAATTTVTCTDDGVYTFKLTAAGSSNTLKATVANAVPVVTSVSGPVAPLSVGKDADLKVPFTDAGKDDTHTCKVDWQDGTTTSGTVAGGVCTASHPYTKAGIYTPVVVVTDDDGGLAAANVESVVVYDPASGYITGSGWYTSPAGAYLADPALTGKARFGMSSQYKKGRPAPEGHINFRFDTGSLDFESETFDWLVVSGSQVQYQGTGTINGTGDYRFLITAVDGGTTGGDRFQMKIWDKTTGTVVYENKPAVALTGGDIVINPAK
jgi:beta-xylosidase/uncharacterized protein YjdB